MGRLFGLDPAPACGCRVLELGCGDGGNALSLAQSLPGAQVLGVDASPGAIERGRRLGRAAGLANVELRCAMFEDLGEELGKFDYIVAHGVYSWVPPQARGALLDCAKRCLAPEGVAFVSYNAYPGSYLRDMARDMLRYHV
ncbi:MAG TPA: class I SAM-dependent methyltransferase, partial [Solirubrobacteraceae bacterium]|nr:class I SAM-dependent methyltransferase [Solirubrobacteraceae bacterium]